MLEKVRKPILPAFFGIDFISDEHKTDTTNYYKGSIHAVIPYALFNCAQYNKLFTLLAIIYFICTTVLYCTKFKDKNEGYFYSHGIILFAIMFYIVLKVG